MPRPTGVTVTAILMAVVACLDIVQAFVALPGGGHSAHPSGTFLAPQVVAIHIVMVAVVGFEFLAVFSFWLGKFWARWLVMAGCFFYLTGLRTLRSQWHTAHFTAGLTVFAAILAVYLLGYLHTDNAKAWFARESLRTSAVGVPTGR